MRATESIFSSDGVQALDGAEAMPLYPKLYQLQSELSRFNQPRSPGRLGAFPDGQSALMLVAARLRHVAGTRCGLRRYLDMSRLTERLMTDQATTDQTTAVA